jgi:hypothetical protein
MLKPIIILHYKKYVPAAAPAAKASAQRGRTLLRHRSNPSHGLTRNNLHTAKKRQQMINYTISIQATKYTADKPILHVYRGKNPSTKTQTNQ